MRRWNDDDAIFDRGLTEWEMTTDDRNRELGEITRVGLTDAQALEAVRPRTGHVVVQRRCQCGAIETGVRHEGHRYICPRHPRHTGRLAA
jgi:hypothetical protein